MEEAKGVLTEPGSTLVSVLYQLFDLEHLLGFAEPPLSAKQEDSA